MGASGVELDVKRCQSGEVVVFHDENLRRLGGRGERVEDLPLAALREIDFGQGQGIPTLYEVLEELGPRMLVNVELKTERVRGDGELAAKVARILERAALGQRALVSSFNPIALAQFGRASPRTLTGLLFQAEQPLPLRAAWAARFLRPAAVHPEAALVDRIAIAAWRRRGYLINVWTVDDPREMAALWALSVDGIITNEPVRALAELRA
jgi:glycerophosphoryl diester phosphodiesterase